MPDKVFYKVGDGFQDAHGRAVDEDGTLLDPAGDADADNLSLQGAGVDEITAAAPKTAAKKASPPAKKK